MGNAFKSLRNRIARLTPEVSEAEAKEALVEEIDGFIRERITFAADLVSESASKKISDGDVVLVEHQVSTTYAMPLPAYVRARLTLARCFLDTGAHAMDQ
jgi:translation initiation factor eIF-2B subunit delta